MGHVPTGDVIVLTNASVTDPQVSAAIIPAGWLVKNEFSYYTISTPIITGGAPPARCLSMMDREEVIGSPAPQFVAKNNQWHLRVWCHPNGAAIGVEVQALIERCVRMTRKRRCIASPYIIERGGIDAASLLRPLLDLEIKLAMNLLPVCQFALDPLLGILRRRGGSRSKHLLLESVLDGFRG